MAGSLDRHQGNATVADLDAYRRRRDDARPRVTIDQLSALPLRRAVLANRFPTWGPWEIEVIALREIGVHLDFCTLSDRRSVGATGLR